MLKLAANIVYLYSFFHLHHTLLDSDKHKSRQCSYTWRLSDNRLFQDLRIHLHLVKKIIIEKIVNCIPWTLSYKTD